MKQRSLFSKPKVEPPKSKPVVSKQMSGSESKVAVGKGDRFAQPFLEKQKLKNPDDIAVYEDIQRHRLQILIWSKMYYHFAQPIVDDKVFDRVGYELVELQKNYPEISKIVAYAEEFEDWDASTGFHLPLDDPWVCWKAKQIINLNRRNGNGKFSN